MPPLRAKAARKANETPPKFMDNRATVPENGREAGPAGGAENRLDTFPGIGPIAGAN
jgi:hypothetical protein